MTTPPVVLVVTGSRKWTDVNAVTEILDEIKPALLVQGGAKGVDTIARNWCDQTGTPCVEVPALWTAHGNAAGPRRNVLMLRIAKALAAARDMDVEVMACPLPDSVGTKHMIEIAQAEELLCYLVTP